ncbi:hypothetical protein Trydic_g2672 [Trypoxylus dichotomus]
MALNTDLFIREIKKRPALYNPNLQEYTDKDFKKRMWLELCSMFIENWNRLTNTEKRFKAKKLQNRWHNLRTCFNREFKKEKREGSLEISSEIAKRRRKYIYYKELSFLRNIRARKRLLSETSCNLEANSSDIDAQMQHENVDTPPLTEISDIDTQMQHENVDTPPLIETPDNSTPCQPIDLTEVKSETCKTPSVETSNETGNDFVEEIDEDKYFLLSLVPGFRRFNEDQKYVARIEIIHVMRRISSSGNV